MVGAIIIGQHSCTFDFRDYFLIGKEIIDSPADVSVASSSFHVPVSIYVNFIWIKISPYINKFIFDNFINPSALYRQKSSVFLVLFWTREVNHLVGSVYVSAKNDIFSIFSQFY